jgi:hypothetical protein
MTVLLPSPVARCHVLGAAELSVVPRSVWTGN